MNRIADAMGERNTPRLADISLSSLARVALAGVLWGLRQWLQRNHPFVADVTSVDKSSVAKRN
jgi:hypothetical protein